jgi:predicted ATPase
MNGSPATATTIRTPDQRLRVFVSSTMRELAPERAAARDAIAQLHLAPVLFELGARPHPPRDLYRAYLAQSDIFIGIYASEYGWVAPDMEISGIEDEYVTCGAQPRLIYVKQASDRDERLQAMLERIGNEGGVSYKRFTTPEELRDLIADDLALLLAERFLPSNAADAAREHIVGPPPGVLPSYATAIVGRHREIAELDSLLARHDVRLLTLTGPGGIGKTRLAVAAAAAARGRFADGVRFVDLQDVRHAGRVLAAIAATLGVKESGETEASEALQHALRDSQQLLVLDNFEQVIAAATALSGLLAAAPRLKLLVTSREPLRIYGEHEFSVVALEVPSLRDTVEQLSSRDAVKLFVERAHAVRPDFALTPENSAAVSEIVRRLDGLPLAIELAAMRVRSLTPQAICDRLRDQLATLAGGARDIPARQRTMRAAITWSYDLLGEEERRVFSRLGVFHDGFLASSAEAVALAGEAGGDALDVIDSFVAKSLLRADVSHSGEPRFRMLEVIREFALEKLDEAGEADAVRERHAHHFTDVASSWHDPLAVGQDESTIRSIDEEYANLRAALSWAIDHVDRAGGAVIDRLLYTLYLYWYMAGRLAEGREISARALDATEQAGNALGRAAALSALASVNMWQGRLQEARREGEAGVAAYRALGMQVRLPYALLIFGVTTLHQGDVDASETALQEALVLFRSTGQVQTTGICLMHLANVASQRGDLEQARRYLDEGLEVQKAYGAGWSVAWFLSNIGELLRIADEHAEARSYYSDALPLLESAGIIGDITRTKFALAYVALRQDDVEAAQRLFRAALDEYGKLGNRRGVAECLQGFASVAVAQDEGLRAARLFGAAERALAEAGAGAWPADEHERQRDMAELRQLIFDADVEREMALGHTLTVEQAAVLAIGHDSHAAHE